MIQIRRSARSFTLLAALAASMAFAAAQVAIATTETSAERHAPSETFLGVMLNTGVYDRFVKAEANLASVGESDPTLVAQIAVNPQAREEWLRRIQQRPKALEALHTAGITPTDYIATVGTLVQTYKVVASQKASKPVPPELAGRIPQENIEFVQAHMTEIDSWKRGQRAQGSRPNTMEDIYSPAPPLPAPAPTTPPPAAKPEQAPDKPADTSEKKP